MDGIGRDAATNALPRKLDGLQVGRAIAALSVVLTHSVAYPYGGHAPHAWHLLGRYGVTLFFIISGFIMVHTTGAGPFDPRRFMANRIRRIVPIYFVANAVLMVLTLVAPGAFRRTVFNAAHIVRSLLFIPSYEPAGTGAIWPFFRLGWTLNYEMFFYVCFAALFALTAGRRALVLGAGFIGLILLGAAHPFTAAIPLFYTRIDTLGFVAGVALGIIGLKGGFQLRWGVMAVVLAASLVGYVYLAIHIDAIKDIVWTQVGMVAVCMAHIALLVLLVDRAGWRAPRWLTFIGDASYSLYLFHMFVIGAVSAVAHRLPPSLTVPLIGVAVVASLVTGGLAYRFVESPLNRLVRGRRPLTAAQIGDDAARAPMGGHAPRP